MHDYDDNKLSAHQQALAATANAVTLQIQERLKHLVARQIDAANPAEVRERLAPFFERLVQAETALWEQARHHVSTAENNASAIAIILVNPPADAVAYVTVCAAKVATALRGMTSLQREAMLADPVVALASNIAFDCEVEFDNEEALARWCKKAVTLGAANR